MKTSVTKILWLTARVSSSLMLAVILWFALLLLSPNHAVAETGPIIDQSQVSATVPDHTAPSTPILISPENNALINDSTPTLVWQASSDDTGIASYSLSLNGTVHFADLPTTNTETSNYTLTYDSDTSYYSLTFKNLLDNDTYTWKITVEDQVGYSTDSVTWTFTIDTKAPNFIVEQVGSEDVSISAHDLSTIPENPVTLKDNEPLLTGTGESASTVDVTITTPDDTEQASFTIDSNGNWQLQLGILPRGVTIYLDFVIQDEAGNISILDDLPLLIEKEEIVIPPTATPTTTPLPPGVSPTPPSTLPPGTPKPPIVIPELSAKEWHHQILKLAKPFLPLSLQGITQQKLIRSPEPDPWYFSILKSAGLLIVLLPAISSFALLVHKFGSYLPLKSLGLLAGLAGLLPNKNNPTGIVFDSDTERGIAYARIIYSGTDNNGNKIFEQTVSNHLGFYTAPELSPGQYVCSVAHNEFTFPTRYSRENHLQVRDFYRGEKFVVTNKQTEHQLCIPVDILAHGKAPTLHLVQKLRYGTKASWFTFAAAILCTFLFPTLWNFAAIGMYLGIKIVYVLKNLNKETGYIINTNKEPLRDGILRFFDANTGATLEIVMTNDNGQFKHSHFSEPLNPQELLVTLVKYGWQLDKLEDVNALIATQISTENNRTP